MKYIAFLFVFLFILPQCVLSQNLEVFNLGNFSLENGEVIYDCEIGYRTFGTLNHDSSNVIIYPTWFGGTSAMLTDLIGPGKIVDDSRFFIIAIDALGNGISSSPSNSRDQPGNRFPAISIGDMVEAQYRLLTEYFEFGRIHGAVGGSMGGMQVFEWLTRYPGYIARAVPYVSTPRVSSYDLLVMNFRRELIETGLRNNISGREIMTLINMTTELHGRTPDYIQRERSRDDMDAYLSSFNREPSSQFTVYNYLTQLNAMIGHDISRPFGGQLSRAAERVQANVLIMVSETDQLIHPAPAIEFAQLINAGLTVLQNDCGHLAVGCELEKSGQLIRAFFSIE